MAQELQGEQAKEPQKQEVEREARQTAERLEKIRKARERFENSIAMAFGLTGASIAGVIILFTSMSRMRYDVFVVVEALIWSVFFGAMAYMLTKILLMVQRVASMRERVSATARRGLSVTDTGVSQQELVSMAVSSQRRSGYKTAYEKRMEEHEKAVESLKKIDEKTLANLVRVSIEEQSKK